MQAHILVDYSMHIIVQTIRQQHLLLLYAMFTNIPVVTGPCTITHGCTDDCATCDGATCFFIYAHRFVPGAECKLYYEDAMSCMNLSPGPVTPEAVTTTCNAPGGGKCGRLADTHRESCVCSPEYYGETCQYRKEGLKQMIRSLTVKYIQFINPGEVHKLEVVVIGNTLADFIGLKEITVSTSEGYYKRIKPSIGQLNNTCAEAAMVCLVFEVNDFKVSFKPFSPHHLSSLEPGQRYDSDGDLWYTGDFNFINGVRRNIGLKITAVQNNLTFSSVNFDIFVNYGAFGRVDLGCVPSIEKITNCKHNSNTPLKYKRSSDIVMENKAIFLKNGSFVNQSNEDHTCEKNANRFWRVDQTGGVLEHSKPFVKESYNEDMIKFKGFTLPFGSYRAYLKWKVVQQGPIENFAYCYFQVIAEPLVAVISGGSGRLVMSHQGLLLSAAESHDPNYKLSETAQLQLRARWYCKRVPDTPDPLCPRWSGLMSISEPYSIEPGRLTPSSVYEFTLYIHSQALYKPNPQYAHVRIEVAPKGSPGSAVYLTCVQNCGNNVVPNQITFIKAKSANASQYAEFKWFYYKTSKQHEDIPADAIMEQNLPPQMLIIKENALEMGTDYTVEVRVYSTGTYSKYSFKTAILVYDGNCTVEPGKGIKGETLFDIVCSQNGTLLYEFYDKTAEEASEDVIFNGRMLGSSSDGKLLNVQLSRGTVVIYAINGYGISANKTFQIELSDSENIDLLNNLLEKLTDSLSRNSAMSESLRSISLIADLILPNEDKRRIFRRLVYETSGIPITTLQEGKLSVSTLSNVLVSLNQPKQLNITTNLMHHLQKLIKDQTNMLKTNIKKRHASRWMSTKEVKQVCKYNLNCLYLAFQSRDKETEGIDSDSFPLQDLIELKQCSDLMETALYNIKDTLSLVQAPGQPPTTISIANDSFIVWVVGNDDEDMPLNRTLTNYKVIPVEISDSLQEALYHITKNEQRLWLVAISFKENVIWWSKSNILSNLVSVSLTRQKLTEDLFHIKTLALPMEIRFNTTDLRWSDTISGTTTQLDTTLDPEYLDLKIEIRRIDLPPKSLSTLTFLFQKTNGSLKIAASLNTRPDYKRVKESTVLITAESPSYTTPYYDNKEPIFLHIGILPGSEVSVNDSVHYTFVLNTKLCQTWRQGLWSSEGCMTVAQSTEKHSYCRCNYISIVGIATPEAIEEKVYLLQAKLFLTVVDNPHVIGFISAIILIYLTMCLTLRCRDTVDRKMRYITVLEDNIPGDPCPYLVAVYTSPRYNAGTTAHVGFRLIGTAASSRAHVFRSSERRVLRQGRDDWFLVFTPYHLNMLSSIHLWHDNAGRSPKWFCSKIFVYDLNENQQYQFVIGEWMALRKNCYPEVMAFPSEKYDAHEVKRIFYENLYMGFRNHHTILSIIYSHPRSEITRVQRASVCMCGLMVSLMSSIMYYKPKVGEIGIDNDQYVITLKELFISLQNLLLSIIISSVVSILFRSRKSQKTLWERLTLTHLSIKNSLIPSKRFSFTKSTNQPHFSNFQRMVTRALHHKPLEPVHLQYRDPFKTIKHWLIITWILCASIIIVCSFLVVKIGLNLGPMKSKQWLTTVLFSMGEDFFLFCPTKIIFYSGFLALAFQKLTELNTYIISSWDIDVVQNQVKDIDLRKIYVRRNNRIYAPLESVYRNKLLDQYEETYKWWLSIDFILSASFVIVTSAVVFKLWSAYYYNSYYILCVITKSVLPYTQPHPFFSVKNIMDLETYFRNTFLYGIYSTRWYNNHLLDEEGLGEMYNNYYWLNDGKNRMIGRPKIRQLRVEPVIVNNHIMPQFFRNPEWSISTEDTRVYSEGWKPGSWYHYRHNETPWIFLKPTFGPSQTFYRLYSSSKRLFHNGGYLTTLGPRRIHAEHTLSDLHNNAWLDMRTRVVFAELTVYNVNYDLFTQVTLMVEHLASDKVLLKAVPVTLRNSLDVSGWEAAFLVYIFYYIVRSFCSLNDQGLETFFLEIKNVLGLIVIALSLIALTYLGLHIHKSTLYSSKFQKKNLDLYFDFDTFAMHFFQMKTILNFLFVVAVFHVLFHMYFGRKISNISCIVLDSLNWLFWIILILYLLTFTLMNVTYLMDISTAFSSQDTMLIHQLMMQFRVSQYKKIEMRIFVCVTVLTTYVIKACFIILFYNTVKLVGVKPLKKSGSYNIAQFLLSKLNRYHKHNTPQQK